MIVQWCKMRLLLIALMGTSLAGAQNQRSGAGLARPNIILIMADDMGYSDLGCYGSEIRTPNLDTLAAGGLRFTNFYNAGRCCPTRASLLTGVYPHQAGIGGMVSRQPAGEGPYQGFLSRNTVTLAEVLGAAGYYTSMSGKWHVGEEHPHWPMDRGFNDYFGLISGGANYFDITRDKRPDLKRNFAKGNEAYLPSDSGFYMTDAITEHAVQMLEGRRKDAQPFFLYVAYTAPHYPLHALPEDIAYYKDKYRMGWDHVRESRYKKLKALGIADESMPLSPKDTLVPAWSNVKDKELFERKMEVYAAQIDRMDQGIGKMMRKLSDIGQTENTIIIFLSDNGGTAEGGLYGEDYWKNGVMPGSVDSFQSYGRGWANASNAPFSYYKQWVHEGGIATPFIINWPAVIKNRGGIVRHPAHVIDIMATFCDLAQTRYPDTYKSNRIVPLEGLSFLPVLKGSRGKQHEYLFWEHMGNMAVMKGSWKLVSKQKEGDGRWALYDLSRDRAERNNLTANRPDLADELLQAYLRWSKQVGVKSEVKETFSYK